MLNKEAWVVMFLFGLLYTSYWQFLFPGFTSSSCFSLDLFLEEVDLQKEGQSDLQQPALDVLRYLRPARVKDPFVMLATAGVHRYESIFALCNSLHRQGYSQGRIP